MDCDSASGPAGQLLITGHPKTGPYAGDSSTKEGVLYRGGMPRPKSWAHGRSSALARTPENTSSRFRPQGFPSAVDPPRRRLGPIRRRSALTGTLGMQIGSNGCRRIASVFPTGYASGTSIRAMPRTPSLAASALKAAARLLLPVTIPCRKARRAPLKGLSLRHGPLKLSDVRPNPGLRFAVGTNQLRQVYT